MSKDKNSWINSIICGMEFNKMELKGLIWTLHNYSNYMKFLLFELRIIPFMNIFIYIFYNIIRNIQNKYKIHSFSKKNYYVFKFIIFDVYFRENIS